MDFNKLIARIKNLFIQPNQEWDAIDREKLTVAEMYTTYLLPVAAVPAIAGFVGMCVVGVSSPLMGTVRVSLVRGIESALFQYVFSLLGVYVGAFILDKLAPTFKSTPNLINALKLVGFTSMLGWAAGILYLVPMLAALVMLVALYSIYVFYLGLPKLMNTPKDKVVPYMLVAAVIILVISIVTAGIAGSVRGGV